MQWISVDDEYPEKYKQVLAFDSTNRKFVITKTVLDSFNLHIWDCAGCIITHWMELPKPPTEVRDEY